MKAARHILITALCALKLVAPALAAENLLGADVEGLLEHARSNNLEYRAMNLEAQAAFERIKPASALPDPKLQVELRDLTRMGEQRATLDPARVGSTRYLLMQELPWFGKRALRADAARAEAAMAQSTASGSWNELAALIKQTQVQRHFINRNEQLNRELLDLMRKLEQIAQTRYAQGLAAQQDVIRAQIEQNELRNELLLLQNERRAMNARLNALLNRPTTAPLAEPGPLPEPPATLTHADLFERLPSGNPQLAAETQRVVVAEKNRDLAYRNRYPDWAVGVAPMQSGNRISEWEVMFQVNIPLQQGARRSQEREASAMLEAARARTQAMRHRLAGELAEAVSAYEAAAQTGKLVATSVLPHTQLSYRSALAGYETGKVDFATLLEAQRQINQSRINQLKALADQHLRLIEIEKLLGDAP